MLCSEPLHGPSPRTGIPEGVPHWQQVRILLMELVTEPDGRRSPHRRTRQRDERALSEAQICSAAAARTVSHTEMMLHEAIVSSPCDTLRYSERAPREPIARELVSIAIGGAKATKFSTVITPIASAGVAHPL